MTSSSFVPRPARKSVRAAPAGPRLVDGLTRFWRWLVAVQAVDRERRLLAEMDDRALRDLGLTRSEARRESRRPLWDLPLDVEGRRRR